MRLFCYNCHAVRTERIQMKLEEMFKDYSEKVRITKSQGTYRFTVAHGSLILKQLKELKIIYLVQLTAASLVQLFDVWSSSIQHATIEKRFGIIKRVLKNDHRFIKGVSDFPAVQYQQKGFKVVPRGDLVSLMAYFRSMAMTPHGLTRYLVFMMLFYTGARSGELCAIRIRNIDLYTCSIMLEQTKNGLPRVVFFDREIVDHLQAYIALDPDRTFLFKDFRYHHDFCPDMVTAILRYACKRLKIPAIHPHMLRHTFATMLVENGCPLVALQYVLGHKDPKTTEIYMHMSTGYLKKNYDLYSPKIDAPGSPRSDLN